MAENFRGGSPSKIIPECSNYVSWEQIFIFEIALRFRIGLLKYIYYTIIGKGTQFAVSKNIVCKVGKTSYKF